MRVLIVKMSSMGDLVHALPMVSDIARAFPRARIDWVVEESFADIAALHPAVSRVIPIALRRWRRQWWLRQNWREFAQWRAALKRQRYHAVIDCQGLIKSALVAAAARGPVIGYGRHSAREPLASVFYQKCYEVSKSGHALDRNRRLAALALGYELPPACDFGLRDHLAVRPVPAELTLQSPFVLLFTHASRATKYWPDDHWLALESQLNARGLNTYLVAGSATERTASQHLAARMRSAHVLPSQRLFGLAAILGAARGAVGLDTGLTHLAAAVGVPTVGIYCDYDPGLVGLRGDGLVCSLGGVNQCPSVDEVASAFFPFLDGMAAS